jgi:hypothetical protein
VEIKAKLRRPLQMHTFMKSCPTSQQHTMVRTEHRGFSRLDMVDSDDETFDPANPDDEDYF